MMKFWLGIVALVVVIVSPLHAQSVWATKKSAWTTMDDAKRAQMEDYATAYKQYIRVARTELSSTAEIIRLAKAKGFALFTEPKQIIPGAKLIFNNRDRALILAVIGTKPLWDGSRLIAAHHDTPRLDLKARPAMEKDGLILLKTNIYGGIKKYQWANLPLMLTGRIDLKGGQRIDITVGDDENEPVFVIPDAAPHVDSPLRERKYTSVLEGEEMMPVAGSVTTQASGIAALFQQIQSQYGFGEEDLVSAELSFVPALQPRDAGLDKSMIAAYGHDDKLCSFAAAYSVMNITGMPVNTALAYMTDNEETGSVNNTGAQSSFLRDTYSAIIEGQTSTFTENTVRKALRNAIVISADVNDGVNPIFPSLSESSNAAKLGYGVAIKSYGRSFNANSELTARIRTLLDDAAIPWQTASYRNETGGGGTIGVFISKENMEVIDMGIPILSMHSVYEMCSKVDLWYFYKTCVAFYGMN
ncbi:MAG: peptidase M18 [Candidatus Kapabacteria bacterium]|nr:peptidase M18 [Candidatus Kapabacteria bacterium]